MISKKVHLSLSEEEVAKFDMLRNELKGFAGFLYFSDTKMMTSPRRFVGCKMSNFISVIFIF